MNDPRKPMFDAARIAGDGTLNARDLAIVHAALDAAGVARAEAVMSNPGGSVSIEAAHTLTARGALEIVSHEAIVQESYKDSVGVWTWSIGITDASGHSVGRYKDNPQPISKCLEVYIWLLRSNYIPDVLAAFGGCELTEAQFTAALSFHYNTGAIKRASWVKSFLAGKPTQAKGEFMEWSKPSSIIERRKKERDLFFDSKWSGNGNATVYPVAKPSYSPRWSGATRVDISADIAGLLA